MIRQISILSSIKLFLLTFLVLTYQSCKKPDTEAPVITLNGSETVIISLESPYTEPGATVTDNEDGSMEAVITGYVNKNQTGTYTITYQAQDRAGNTASANRNVIVKNDAESLIGNYSGTGSLTYNDTIRVSETKNNRIHFSKFSNYVWNSYIYVDVSGTTITLPSQTAVQVGSPAADRLFIGSGSVTTDGFTLNWTETTNGSTTSVSETYTKQP